MGKKKNEQEDVPVNAFPEDRETALVLPDEDPLSVLDDAEVSPPPRVEEEPVFLPKARKKKPVTTHKVTEFAGTLKRDGVTYEIGEGLNLTDEEARLLGPAVEPA